MTTHVKKEFTGLWIEKQVLSDPRFRGHEMIVYAYMSNLGDRFAASDRHIAKQLGMSPKTVRNTMAKLRAKGFVAGTWYTRKPVPYANVPK